MLAPSFPALAAASGKAVHRDDDDDDDRGRYINIYLTYKSNVRVRNRVRGQERRRKR